MCVTRYLGGHTWLWRMPSLSFSATGKGVQQGKGRAIVPNKPLRQRFTHLHQCQMCWLAIASASWRHKMRIWCGGQDMAEAEAGRRHVLGAGRAMLLKSSASFVQPSL